MNHELSTAQSILITASPEAVWEVLTQPEQIAKYLFGTQTITDWKVGSTIVFQGEYNGQSYLDKGIVKENKLHERIVYAYWSGFSGLEDLPENYSTITYLIEKVADKQVNFTWQQQGFFSEEGLKHAASGLPAMLGQIKQQAEEI
ncbi:MAG TPA: SRPBCC domain-containing protein [Bacteroidetes bacterium]|nr:SRPBCC domain-containing protein [Bacteroidota bacterium]